MKRPTTAIAISLILGCLTQAVILNPAHGADRKPPPTGLPTDPGTPTLIPAGPDAEALATVAQKKVASANDGANNPTEAMPGANPPPKVDGNFLIGPKYVQAPELSVNTGVPQGRVQQFNMDSTDSKSYPGIARNAFGTVDPNNPKTLIVETHPAPYTRTITVYIPSQYASGTAAPFLVTHDGSRMGNPDLSLPHILDNMIAQHRLPVMLVVMIANGGGDAQGSERGLEYDTMSGKFAEFIQSEVLPLVEKNCQVKLTKDPEGRATMGGSSGGAAALEMAWYHPDWYHRVISYSGTFVNQQWPFNPETPDGAWDFHEELIPKSAPKPLRIWLEVGDRDLLNPNIMRDNLHDWVAANNRMATVLKAKGYHYQYLFAVNAGHVDRAAKNQTLPEALEWVWQGYALTLLFRLDHKLPRDFDWTHKVLDGVDLEEADLSGMDFRNCSLRYASFANASFESAIFDNCDLTGVRFEETKPVLAVTAFSTDRIVAFYGDGALREWRVQAGGKANSRVLTSVPPEPDSALGFHESGQMWLRTSRTWHFLGSSENGSQPQGSFTLKPTYRCVWSAGNVAAVTDESENTTVRVMLVDLMKQTVICTREARRARWCAALGSDALVWSDAEVGVRVASVRGKPAEEEISLTCPEPTCLAVGCCGCRSYLIGTGDSDGTICVWRLNLQEKPWSERKLLEVKAHENSVTSIAFSSDSCVVSGSEDRAIVLTRFADNATLAGHIERRLRLTIRCRGMRIAGMKGTSERELLAKLIAESQ